MWVFGYGSLMWDGWEHQFDGRRIQGARLANYRRSLTKKSTNRWGTHNAPCPTLTIEPSNGATCIGCAFDLPDHHANRVIDYLARREGASMELRELPIDLPNTSTAQALTALLRPDTSLRVRNPTPQQLAEMIQHATGTAGNCLAYLTNLRTQLRELGVVDPAIEAIAHRVVATTDQSS